MNFDLNFVVQLITCLSFGIIIATLKDIYYELRKIVAHQLETAANKTVLTPIIIKSEKKLDKELEAKAALPVEKPKRKYGVRHFYTDEQVKSIRRLHKNGMTRTELAKKFNIPYTSMWYLIKGRK